jgi:hypothetical protein
MTAPVKRETWVVERVEGKTLSEALIRQIAGERRTGSLTINFSQGHIATAEWKQKQPEPKEPPHGV